MSPKCSKYVAADSGIDCCKSRAGLLKWSLGSWRDRLREHLTIALLKREEFVYRKWENEQRIPEQQFLEDLVMHQVLVVYSDGCGRKTKDIYLKLWPLLSKVTLSLHSVAMFQCPCKICPTFLCIMCVFV